MNSPLSQGLLLQIKAVKITNDAELEFVLSPS